MRALFVASECFPLVKTGGLADVVGALPAALAAHECEARVLLPAYRGVVESLEDTRRLAEFRGLFGGDAVLFRGRARTGLTVYALHAPHFYDRPGNPYIDETGADWPDNHLRFAALCLVGAHLARHGAGRWRPDIVHVHDWQAALVPAYLVQSRQPRPPVVATIHNIAYQGMFPSEVLADIRLEADQFGSDGVEFWGRINYLKAALVYADMITTVSPTYAREIRTSAFGHGLEGVLQSRADRLVGLLNGIDDTVWNPRKDDLIAAPFSRFKMAPRLRNRMALQEEFGLQADDRALLFALVSRLTHQKGIDLVLDVLPQLLENGGQLAVLGTGEPQLEEALRNAATSHPGRVGVRIEYDERLSHLLQAGADAVLLPSRFEPCGLTQLYALRYGAVPIVSRTGGLADTIIDANPAAMAEASATGIQFSPTTSEALGFALERAFELFADHANWRRMQLHGMAQLFNWDRSALVYAELYRSLLEMGREGDV